MPSLGFQAWQPRLGVRNPWVIALICAFLAWPGMARPGQDWTGSAALGQDGPDQPCHLAQPCQASLGQACPGWKGHGRPGLA